MTPGLQLATGLGGISLQLGEVQGGFVEEAATGLSTSKVLVVGKLQHIRVDTSILIGFFRSMGSSFFGQPG